MRNLLIDEREPRLVIALGDDQQEGPKLRMRALLFGVVIFFLILAIYLTLPIPKKYSGLGGYIALYVGLGVFCYILQDEYRPRLRQFGLSRDVLRCRRTHAWIAAGLVLGGANLGLIYGSGYLVSVMGLLHHTFTPGLQPLSRILRQPFRPLIIGVIAPTLEELFFRGYLYLVLRQNWGRRRAALISSAVFAACHFWNALFALRVFFGSLLDIYLDNKARSLAPSIADHASYNLVLSVIRFSRT